jgi:hypothetical protein
MVLKVPIKQRADDGDLRDVVRQVREALSGVMGVCVQ